jgi:hypothetical protein
MRTNLRDGTLGGNALPALANTPINATGESDAGPVAATHITLNIGAPPTFEIDINQTGLFFAGGFYSGVSFQGAPIITGRPLFQAVVLLHELGHVTGALALDGPGVPNGQSISHANTAAILAKCAKTIAGFSNAIPN